MKTIVVPTDLSSLADSALQVAADLARTYEAEILLVHVMPFSIARVPEGIHAWMSELAQEKSIDDYELHIRHARTVETSILNYAYERKADLIVLYTHGSAPSVTGQRRRRRVEPRSRAGAYSTTK